MPSAGLWMLVTVALVMIASGLPTWVVLIGVSLLFAIVGILGGTIDFALLTALPARLLGLLENDLLQALPLYVLIGAMLNRLPLAEVLFRVGSSAARHTGAGPSMAGLALGVLFAPMNGSVGASVAMLARIVQPRLDASGIATERGAAVICASSTLGVVVPPSLVLILLGDSMLRAHTEAVNATGQAVRIINTQDVFRGALTPAAILLLLYALITWREGKSGPRPAARVSDEPTRLDWLNAAMTVAIIVALLAGVTLGYLYAVEAAATGGVALSLAGLATRTLSFAKLKEILHDTMAVTGALFSLLIAATTFTLTLRAFGTDRWVASFLTSLGGGTYGALLVVLLLLALCAFVLDAFEMIFVVIPVVMPPLLVRVPDATWVAVLTLLILQASFMMPPFGYSVLMVRNRLSTHVDTRMLAGALLPYLLAQLFVLALVLGAPRLVWHDGLDQATQTAPVKALSDKELQELLWRQLDQGKSEQTTKDQPPE